MHRIIALLMLVATLLPHAATAQELKIATVSRPPFSMVIDGQDTGFAVDLMRALATEMGQTFTLFRYASFPEMLEAVQSGTNDAAIANISITAEREQAMDFSYPIFSSGLQIMIPANASGASSIWMVLFSLDILLAIVAAFVALLLGGMLMWWLERRAQPYFDRPAREAVFPAFWWALNLVVNGGFEERVPQTRFGRLFAVLLVISSLFVVSVFVARITSVMTVAAINSNVTSINDLYGKNVGTIDGSTAAAYLNRRELEFDGYPDLDTLLAGFEAGDLDAVVFDAPVLAYYTNTTGKKHGQMTGPVFLRENYGVALPSGSPIAEDINQALLHLRENGTYQRLFVKWFGTNAF